MKKFATFKLCIITLFTLIYTHSYSQTIIDYSSWTGASGCNIFAGTVNVPATLNGNPSSIEHTTTIGQPVYNYTQKSIQMDCQNSMGVYGTEYKIKGNFKQNYSYKITVNAISVLGTGQTASPNLRLDMNNATSFNNSCTGVQFIDQSTNGGLKQTQAPPSDNYYDRIYDYQSLSANQTYLLIAAIPISSSNFNSIYIRKIKIEEFPPTPTFTLTPSAVTISCGSTTPQIFTVNNVYNSPGTLSYNWNLGSSNNGWNYNGSPAPATFSTTVNNISLTPNINNTSLSNVNVTVVLNGSNYSTLSSAVTFTNPTFSITGPLVICPSGNYIINGLPSGSTVNWITSDPNTISISSSGTARSINSGVATISANVVLPSGCSNTVTPLSVVSGTPTPVGIDGPSHDLCYNGRQSEVANFYVHNPISNLIYNWQIDGLNVGGSAGGTYTRVDAFQWGVGPHQIQVRSYSTTCGNSSYYSASFFIVDCSVPSYNISPNPAGNYIKVTTNNSAKNNGIRKEIRELQLIDKMGNLKYREKLSPGTNVKTILTSNLPNDIYTLRIFDGKTWDSHKVSVQH